jgi:hypothetical protein
LKFLGRAKMFLQSLASEAPSRVQYFNVTCASGHRVRGERTEGYQALRCPACGEGVFVLPRSPLPEPVAPPAADEPRPAGVRFGETFIDEGPVELADADHLAVELVDREPERGGAEIIWDDTPRKADSPRGRTSPTAKDAGSVLQRPYEPGEVEDTVQPSARAAPPPRPRARPEPVEGAAPGSPAVRPGAAAASEASDAGAKRRESRAKATAARSARPRRGRELPIPAILEVESVPKPRARSRLRLLILLLPLLVLATVAWRVWRSYRQEFPLIVERGRTEGIAALEDGDFDRAYQLLSAAKTAVDGLGGAVEDADEIRHAADEAALFVDPAPLLEDLLAEAARTNPETWATRFDTLYKGRSVFIQSRIRAIPQGSSGYQLWYRVFSPGEASTPRDGGMPRADRFADIDLAGFELLELARIAVDRDVCFGARIASFRYDSDQKHWVVRLEPKSGVFVLHRKALEAAGWPLPKASSDLPEFRP